MDAMNRSEVVNETLIDRLSDLPDAVVLHILSLMDTKYAVQTCVLSTRWAYLWTNLPSLHFDPRSFKYRSPPDSFSNFVLHVLSMRKPCNIHSLTVWYSSDIYGYDNIMELIIKYAVEHGVQQISVNNEDCFTPCFLSCPSLRTLKIQCFKLHCHKLFDHPVFASLTSLHLEAICLIENDHSIDLFSSCVNLEQLFLTGCGFNDFTSRKVKISSPRLVNLTVAFPFAELIISAPRLSVFNYMVGSSTYCDYQLSMEGCLLLTRVNIEIEPFKNFLFRNNNEVHLGSYMNDWYQKVIREIIPKTKLLMLELGGCKMTFMKSNELASIEIHGAKTNYGKMSLSWKLDRSKDAELISCLLEDTMERVGLVEFFGRVGFIFCHSIFWTRSHCNTILVRVFQGLFPESNIDVNQNESASSMILAELPSIRAALNLAWDNMFRYIEEELAIQYSQTGDTSAKMPIADYKSLLSRKWQFIVTRTLHNEVLWQMHWPTEAAKLS